LSAAAIRELLVRVADGDQRPNPDRGNLLAAPPSVNACDMTA
jgi:hypothetical protein